jgi:hypothetical protein
MILVQALIDLRHLPLAKGVVEHIIDGVHRNAQTRGCVAVDGDKGAGAGVLLVDVDVGDGGGLGFQRLDQLVADILEQVGIVGVQHILIGGVGLTPARAQILDRVEEQADTAHTGQLGAHALDHLIGGGRSPRGFSVAKRKPPPARLPPLKATTVSMAGSSRTIFTIWVSLSFMAVKLIDWSARRPPLRAPVSCWGRSPWGRR